MNRNDAVYYVVVAIVIGAAICITDLIKAMNYETCLNAKKSDATLVCKQP